MERATSWGILISVVAAFAAPATGFAQTAKDDAPAAASALATLAFVAAPAPVVAMVPAAPPVDDPEPSRAGRVVVETLVGGLSAGAGLYIGGAIGAGSCNGGSGGSSSHNDSGYDDSSDGDWSGAFDCLGDVLLGASIGYLLAAPLGTWGAGSLMDGNGSLGATFLGEAVGVGAMLLVLTAANGVDGEEIGAVALLTLPVIGAVVGYELTSDASAERAEARRTKAGLSLTPVVAVNQHGGSLGFVAQF